MTLIVHAISGAPAPWRVLAGLTFKKLDYDIRYLEGSKGEHKSPEFLKLNPRGTVPVLENDGLIQRDSIGILAWLDRQYPDHPLFGNSPTDAGQIWQIALENAGYLRPAHNDVFFPIMVQGKPVPDKATQDGKAVLEAVDNLKAECARLEALLGAGRFLFGNTPTAADAVAFPDIRLIQRAMETKPDEIAAIGLSAFATLFPRLDDWTVRVENVPGMDKTLPPHWVV